MLHPFYFLVLLVSFARYQQDVLRPGEVERRTNGLLPVGDVHHEIDVCVAVGAAKGYESVFLFECKNWADPVGKNEIIVFAAKIDAAVAQPGYFVAKQFTKDALAQAAKDADALKAAKAAQDAKDAREAKAAQALKDAQAAKDADTIKAAKAAREARSPARYGPLKSTPRCATSGCRAISSPTASGRR